MFVLIPIDICSFARISLRLEDWILLVSEHLEPTVPTEESLDLYYLSATYFTSKIDIMSP